MKLFIFAITFMPFVCLHAGAARAQTDASGGETEIEELYDRLDKDDSAKRKKSEEKAARKPEKKPDATNLTELSKLAPFADVAVIQKRFLPKTGRFELTGTILTGLNNPFFNNLGGTGRLAYYFREKYGVELMYFYLGNSERQVTKDLKKNVSIKTDSLVTPKSFMGVAFKWNPIYGKMTFLNNQIVPFDLNFNIGAGTTAISTGGSETTIHMGTSQVFALSKAMAVRWDFAWNMYSATVTQSDGTKKRGGQQDLFVGLGMSFYFPEATYR